VRELLRWIAMSIKVLIVDDRPVVQEGLRSFFADTAIGHCYFATDRELAESEFRRRRPDIVLLEPKLRGDDGFLLLESLFETDPDARVIIFTDFDDPTQIARAAALGAREFLHKTSSPETILRTIQAVSNGDPLPESSVLAEFRKNLRRRKPEFAENTPLTNRELQVLRHVAMGLSNREIGKSLEISIETVKEHVQNILRKLDVNDRTQAAVWAVRRDLI
jgi:DNA-binding NarL/FixJ family response regulator